MIHVSYYNTYMIIRNIHISKYLYLFLSLFIKSHFNSSFSFNFLESGSIPLLVTLPSYYIIIQHGYIIQTICAFYYTFPCSSLTNIITSKVSNLILIAVSLFVYKLNSQVCLGPFLHLQIFQSRLFHLILQINGSSENVFFL